jgi:hypothetical protein
LITPVRFVNIFHARNQLGRARGRQRRVERISIIVQGRGGKNRIRLHKTCNNILPSKIITNDLNFKYKVCIIQN